MRIIDLSHTIESTPTDLPDFMRVDVSYTDHDFGASEMEDGFGIPRRLLRDGEGPSGERLAIGTHAGTHVDAPWHYNSVVQGKPARTIDQLPLESFFGPGVVVDAHAKADGDAVTKQEMDEGIRASGHHLRPRDIVLVRTGRDRFYHDPNYMLRGCGVSAEATLWLYDEGVRVMGIDAWGWDAPLDRQAAVAIDRDEPGIFWAAHQIDRAYSQIERMTNLDALPTTGFTVACFPLKIKGASAGLTRAVAIIDGDEGAPNDY
jgi:kynurenine formamidase